MYPTGNRPVHVTLGLIIVWSGKGNPRLLAFLYIITVFVNSAISQYSGRLFDERLSLVTGVLLFHMCQLQMDSEDGIGIPVGGQWGWEVLLG